MDDHKDVPVLSMFIAEGTKTRLQIAHKRYKKERFNTRKPGIDIGQRTVDLTPNTVVLPDFI